VTFGEDERYLEVSLEERGEERQWKSVTFGEDEIPGGIP
jgi:hypothetical protein